MRAMIPVHMVEYSIGLDLGGTNLRAAAIDSAGTMLDKKSGLTNFADGREAVLTDIVAAIAGLREQHGAGRIERHWGGCAPGLSASARGFITNSNNLPFLRELSGARRDQPPPEGSRDSGKRRQRGRVGREMRMGAGKDVDDLVLLTLGTGVGGGIISNGRVLRGFVGMAGELGHITVVPNGNPCGCGNQGCLEKHASATAVVAMAQLMHLGENVTSKDVGAIARQHGEAGDKARAIWRSVGDALGIALATLVNTFNFPLYLLSGGPLPSWEFFAPTMLQTLEKAIVHLPRHQTADRAGDAWQ